MSGSLREILFSPLPLWVKKILAVPCLLAAILTGLACAAAVVAALKASRGMATVGLLALAGWLLLECILALWVSIDFWRGIQD